MKTKTWIDYRWDEALDTIRETMSGVDEEAEVEGIICCVAIVPERFVDHDIRMAHKRACAEYERESVSDLSWRE